MFTNILKITGILGVGISFFVMAKLREKGVKSVAYDMLLYYSKVEILVKNKYKHLIENKYISKVLNHIKSVWIWKDNYVVSIKNGDVYNEYSLFAPDLFDFYIYSKQNEKYIVFDEKDLQLNGKRERCTFKFISFHVFLKEKIYPIVLQTEEFTFYVEKNVINKQVLLYLLKSQHNLSYKLLLNYQIQIIDHNIHILSLNDTDEIIFHKDTYEIKGKEEAELIEEEFNVEAELIEEEETNDNSSIHVLEDSSIHVLEDSSIEEETTKKPKKWFSFVKNSIVSLFHKKKNNNIKEFK